MKLQHPDGTTTYLETAGDTSDTSILLLHGIGADHKMWKPQMEWLADRRFHVLAPDLLGHGLSSKMDSLTLETWENQINEILYQLDVPQVILVGVSMGGVIAQSYAMHFPEKISRLVLSDTFGELETLQEKMLGYSQVIGFQLYKILGGKLLAKGMASAYKAPYAALAKDYFSKVSLTVDFDQLILARKAINTIDAIGKIDGNSLPTLVMVGDQFGKMFIDINQKISDGINGSDFFIIENSMDPSNLVNPKAFNQKLLEFCLR